MNAELLTLLQALGIYLLANLLLWLFYRFVYREKVSYNESRLFLLSIALVSIPLSQFRIPVFEGKAQVVEVEAPARDYGSATLFSMGDLVPVPASEGLWNSVPFTQTTANIPNVQSTLQKGASPAKSMFSVAGILAFWNRTTWFQKILAAWGLITLVLMVSLLAQFFKIIRLKRKGRVEVMEGYTLVVGPSVPTPFSFGRHIFVGSDLRGSKLDMILQHERWHIRHHHYRDVFMMEILIRLFWFNPLMWLIRKELRSIHEFQADQSVLEEGYDLYHYQTVILEEVMGNQSCLANGFNHSFTKKRFVMMKKQLSFRMSGFRHAAFVPYLALVFGLLCFTESKGQTKVVVKNPSQTSTQTDFQTDSSRVIVRTEQKIVNGDTVTTTTTSTVQVNAISVPNVNTLMNGFANTSGEIQKKLDNMSAMVDVALMQLKKLSSYEDYTRKEEEIEALMKTLDIKFNGSDVNKGPLTDEFLQSLKKEDFKESAEVMENLKAKLDALKNADVSQKAFLGLASDMMPLMTTGVIKKMFDEFFRQMGVSGSGLESLNLIKGNKTIETVRESTDDNLLKNAYRVKKDEVVFSSSSMDKGVCITAIEQNSQLTLVTLAIPIENGNNWIAIDKGFHILDQKTGDKYMIRRCGLNPSFPLSTPLLHPGINNKVIELVLVFPPLKKTVKVIDVVETVTSDWNHQSGWAFRNLRLSDYTKKAKTFY